MPIVTGSRIQLWNQNISSPFWLTCRQKANLAGLGATENLRLHPRRDERSRERREAALIAFELTRIPTLSP